MFTSSIMCDYNTTIKTLSRSSRRSISPVYNERISGNGWGNQKMKIKKAPGPDGIPPEAVKVKVAKHPRYTIDLMNEALSKGEFPGE